MSLDLIVTMTRGDLQALVGEAVANALAEYSPEQGPSLMTATELCERLRISMPTLRKLRGEGLPTLMVVESPRFDWSAVVTWLGNNSGEALLASSSDSEDLAGSSKVVSPNQTQANRKALKTMRKATVERNLAQQALEPSKSGVHR
jgi:hypothetical protein